MYEKKDNNLTDPILFICMYVGGLVPPPLIGRALRNMTSGMFNRIQVNYSQLARYGGFQYLSNRLVPGERLLLEFSNGFVVPFNDFNRFSMMATADAVMRAGPGVAGDWGSGVVQIAEGIQVNPIFTIRTAYINQDGAYRHWTAEARRQLHRRGILNNPPPARVRTHVWGGFYPWYLSHPLLKEFGISFKRYGIMDEDKLEDSFCLFTALKHAGVSDIKLEKLKTMVWCKRVPRNKLAEIADTLQIKIKLAEHALTDKNRKENSYKRPKVYPYRQGSSLREFAEYAKDWEGPYNIAIADNHYFVDDYETGITKAALFKLVDYMEECQDEKKTVCYTGMKPKWHPMHRSRESNRCDKAKQGMRSTTLLQLLGCNDIRKAILKPVTINHDTLNHVFFDELDNEYKTLEYCKEDCMPYGEKPQPEDEAPTRGRNRKHRRVNENGDYAEDEPYKKGPQIYAFDFESTTDGKIHRPYMVSYMRVPSQQDVDSHPDGTNMLLPYEMKSKVGYDCASKMMDDIYSNFDRDLYTHVEMKAHNLTYDARFMFEILNGKEPPKIIENCGKLKSLKGSYYPVTSAGKAGSEIKISFSDTYAFIGAKLSKFPKMFDFKVISQRYGKIVKEIMPYNFYTERRMWGSATDEFKRSDANVAMILKGKTIHKHMTKDFMDEVRKQSHRKSIKAKYCMTTGTYGVKTKIDTKTQAKVLDDIAELDVKTVHNNCVNWGCYWGADDEMIDAVKYATKYCEQDVRVLAYGWMKYRDDMSNLIDINLDQTPSGNSYVSITQAVHDYCKNEDVFKDCCWLSGVPGNYIQKCVVGGQTMLARNKKQKSIKGKPVFDNDATSLYPSAMKYMPGYLKGKPKVINTERYATADHENWDGYFMRITVDSFGSKSRDFPMLSFIHPKTKTRIFSDNLDEIPGGSKHKFWITRYTLEAMLKFYPGFRYRIYDGYYFDEGFNNKIAQVTQKLFELRLKLKKEKNPMQAQVKVIMNSLYGRTLLGAPKHVDHFRLNPYSPWWDPERRLKIADDNENWFQKHFEDLIEYYEMPKNSRFGYRFKVNKPLTEHYNAPHMGGQILAFSKLWMMYMIQLAYDLGIKIFYMDTDSIHLYSEDLPRLETAYDEAYYKTGQRPSMNGKGLGQFHSDFDFEDILDADIRQVMLKHGILDSDKFPIYTKDKPLSEFIDEDSVESIEFIGPGKKAYADHLRVKAKGNPHWYYEAVHFRLKGCTPDSVYQAATKHDITVMDFYNDLYNNKEYIVDMQAGGRPCFRMMPNYTATTLTEFSRKVSFRNVPNS